MLPDEDSPEVPRIGEDPERDERSRTSKKTERVEAERALTALARALLPLGPDKWARLGVPDDAAAALADAARISAPAPLERQLRLVRARLRDADWVGVRRRLDLVRAGYALPSGQTATSSDAERWVEHLLVHGDAGLERLLSEHPEGDRKRLRQLVRGVLAAPEARRARARAQLDRAVSQLVERR